MVLILFLPLFQEGNVGTFILPRKKLRRCDMAETGLSVRIWFIWTLGRWDFFQVFVEFKVSLYTKDYTSRGDLDILWNCLVEYHHNSVSIRRSYWNIFFKRIIFLPKSYMSFVFWTFIFIICYLMFHYQIISFWYEKLYPGVMSHLKSESADIINYYLLTEFDGNKRVVNTKRFISPWKTVWLFICINLNFLHPITLCAKFD